MLQLKQVKIFILILLLVSGSYIAASENTDAMSINVNHLWILIATIFIFMMQAGFLALEIGLVRPKTVTSVAMKNIIDWIIVSIVFFVCGFGIMFGSSWDGLIGCDLFFLSNIEQHDLHYFFFLFQLVFAGTAITIISGIMCGRTGFIAYICIAAFSAVFIYPIYGHWVWGNALAENNAWLANIGYIDFAGSSVVHLVGATIGVVGIWFLGARIGRFNSKGEVVKFEKTGWGWTVLGTIILWIGWWGFNGGSSLEFNSKIGKLVTNTNISGAFGGLTALLHCFFFQRRRDVYEKIVGGCLGGLVAITACCHVVSPVSASLIGIGAGIIHNWAFDVVMTKWCLDDPVGGIPVHGFCGIWGILCVGIFGDIQFFAGHSRIEQIAIQITGVAVCLVWTGVSSFIMFKLIQITIGLRISPQQEQRGIALDTPDDDGLQEQKVNKELPENRISFTQETIDIALVKSGGYNLVSEEDFVNIPLQQRITMINENKVQFLVNNKVVPTHEGLEKLNKRTGNIEKKVKNKGFVK